MDAASFLFATDHRSAFAEKHRDAPQTGKANNCIDDSAYNGILAAEDPGYKIKLEQTNQSPVYGADDGNE